jgi:hypothetical protein
MRKVLVVVTCAMMSVAIWGCKSHEKHEEKKSTTTTKPAAKASADSVSTLRIG